MYRGIDWHVVMVALTGEMDWTWMLLSMPFGITAQLFRALRWQQVLSPMGRKPRLSTCVNSIFLSYASSLAIPRSGEVLRCGVLKKWEGVDLSRLVGSVVAERVVDMTMILVLSVITILVQVPVFLSFVESTGMSAEGVLSRFTVTGYWVTGLCVALIVLTLCWMVRRLKLFSRSKNVLRGLMEGIMSIRKVESPALFLICSIGIWVSYFLHFYLTFRCFCYTGELPLSCSLVAFVVGTFAVLVPTPNGAGPWHFAVKTVLMLYGVNGDDGAVFALIVHTLQTLLVVALGLYSLLALYLTKSINNLNNEQL